MGIREGGTGVAIKENGRGSNPDYHGKGEENLGSRGEFESVDRTESNDGSDHSPPGEVLRRSPREGIKNPRFAEPSLRVAGQN